MLKVKLKPWLMAALVAWVGVALPAHAQSPDAVPAVIAFDKTAKPLGKKYRVAYLTQCVNNPYCQASLKGITDASKKYGFEFKIFDANFNPAEQLKLVQNAVTEKFDGYLFAPTASAPGCSMYKNQLAPTGKPVVTFDIMMCGDKDYTPGTAAAVIMQTQAYYDDVVDKGFARCVGTCTAAAIGGYVGSDLYNVWEAALAKAVKKYPNVKLIVDQPGNFSPQVALRVTQDSLRAHPEINMMISSWDDMSRGVIQAITDAKKVPGKDIKVVSDGATTDGVARVVKGEIDLTGIILPYEEGYYAGVAMAMALDGQAPNGFVDEAKLPPVVNGPKTIILTKDNVAEFKPNY